MLLMAHYGLGSKDNSIRRDDINFLGSLVSNEDICLANISEQIQLNVIVAYGGKTCSWLAPSNTQKIIPTAADFSPKTGLKASSGCRSDFLNLACQVKCLNIKILWIYFTWPR